MTKPALDRSHDFLGSPIRDVRSSWLRVRVLEGFLTAVCAFCAAALAGFALDNLLSLPRGMRLVLLLATLLSVLVILAWSIRRALALTNVQAALLLERNNPALGNRLINALLLRRDPAAEKSQFLVSLMKETKGALEKTRLEPAVSRAPLKRRIPAALCVVAMLAAYAVLMPEPFQNALDRFSHPLSHVAPLSRYSLRIIPGEATRHFGEPLIVQAAPEGATPPSARILLRSEDEEEDLPMDFAGGRFYFRVDRVVSDFSYRILAEDFRSPYYPVKVVKVPKPKLFRITCDFPAYTGIEPRIEEVATGDVIALTDTLVKLEILPDREASGGALLFHDAEPKSLVKNSEGRLAALFHLKGSTSYQVALESPEGLVDPEPPEYEIQALTDAPPLIEITEPGRNVAATGADDLPVMINARDDVGLKEIQLLRIHPDKEGAEAERTIGRWTFEPATLQAVATGLFPLKGLPQGTLYYRARTWDRAGLAAESKTFQVTLLAVGVDPSQAAEALESLLTRLRRILDLQLQALRAADKLKSDLDGMKDKPFSKRSGLLVKTQKTILNLCRRIIEDWTDRPETLDDLAKGKMPEAVEAAKEALQSKALSRAPALDRLMEKQRLIASGLNEILEEKMEMLEALKGDPLTLREERAVEEEAAAAAAREAVKTLKEFAEEQRLVLKTTQDFLQEKGEDFSDLDPSLIEELKQTEEKWGEILKSLADDYHKLQPQDFSDSTLSDEFVELYSEVEAAAEALEKKAVEIAVPHEQSGLELAESITANLERWLADEADYIQWSMEDPDEEYEVPMAELPSELEDIVGDLIDSEESMMDEVEDITSGWMDSLNEGAGWDLSDGPISNMSAKGITGNILPNRHEVGGRSGEGRSGRSHGQMVEKTAQGKGGRQTPTRLTPDPYEAGQVKDTSQDPEGGSTGAGKLSGSGAEGLRGPESPEVEARMDRLAGRQSEIRQEGEKLKSALNRRGYHPQDLDRALALMEQMEQALHNYEQRNYPEAARRIIGKLEHTKTLLGTSRRILLERTHRFPKTVRDALKSAFDEEAPNEYRALISRYYRSLAEDGEK